MPSFHLIHTITDNHEVKCAFLTCHDNPGGRLYIENWNSEDREPSVWQVMAIDWNDIQFLPETEEIPDLHSGYATSETISHQLVADMHLTTPKQCEEKMNSMILKLNHIIVN